MRYEPNRSEEDKAHIANIRRLALEDEAGDVGSYMMWLEDKLNQAWGALDYVPERGEQCSTNSLTSS